MQTSTPPKPFTSDPEYLDAEFHWLRLHVRVLNLTRQIKEAKSDTTFSRCRRVGRGRPVSVLELSRRLNTVKEKEKAFREAVDSRLEIHRKSGGFTLGLDIVVEQYGLTGNERFLLLVLALPAVSGFLAEAVLGEISVFGSRLQVQEIVGLLEPSGTGDWLQHRRLFHVDSLLVANGLISLDYPGTDCVPGDIWHTDASLTSRALSVITGDHSILNEDENGGH